MVDLDGEHVVLADDEGEFFLHLQCFVDNDYLKDEDVTGKAVAESMINKN